MKDNRISIAVAAGVLVNILAIGLAITQTDSVYSQGVCLVANIISLTILTIILAIGESSTKE